MVFLFTYSHEKLIYVVGKVIYLKVRVEGNRSIQTFSQSCRQYIVTSFIAKTSTTQKQKQ